MEISAVYFVEGNYPRFTSAFFMQIIVPIRAFCAQREMVSNSYCSAQTSAYSAGEVLVCLCGARSVLLAIA